MLGSTFYLRVGLQRNVRHIILFLPSVKMRGDMKSKSCMAYFFLTSRDETGVFQCDRYPSIELRRDSHH